MTKKTQPYTKQTFAGSVAAGLGSIFKANGKKYYILEHKVTSKYHKAGEWQEIIVDNIELGRSDKCQVQFDESFKTVSGRHAAIVKDGDNWKLVQLSKTNSTLLNGQKVASEYYLHNGDEIQLSINGPKLGFIIPTGAKSTVGTIGLTRRLSLFRQQALKPYKTAITVLSIVLLLSVSGLTAKIIYDNHQIAKYKSEIAEQQRKADEEREILRREAEERERIAEEERQKTAKALEESKRQQAEYEAQLAEMEKQREADQQVIANLKNNINNLKNKVATISGPVATELKQFEKDILFLYVSEVRVNGKPLKMRNGKNLGWTGTAFLCDDGKVVTAKHCVEGWLFDAGDILDILNSQSMELLLGYLFNPNSTNIEADINLYNANQEFSLKSTQFRTGPSGYYQASDGSKYIACTKWGNDWAYAEVGKKGSIHRNGTAARNLKAGQKLSVMGFPHGVGGGDRPQSNITPMFSTCTVAHDKGLQGGVIEVSENGTAQGNSGGPVFATNNGKIEVVGLVSYGVGNQGKVGGMCSVSQF